MMVEVVYCHTKLSIYKWRNRLLGIEKYIALKSKSRDNCEDLRAVVCV